MMSAVAMGLFFWLWEQKVADNLFENVVNVSAWQSPVVNTEVDPKPVCFQLFRHMGVDEQQLGRNQFVTMQLFFNMFSEETA